MCNIRGVIFIFPDVTKHGNDPKIIREEFFQHCRELLWMMIQFQVSL